MTSAIDSTLDGDLTADGRSVDKANFQAALAAAASEITALQEGGGVGRPAMFASVPTTRSSVTGDGTAYVVDFGAADFDKTSDWDGSTTFTASVAGVYRIETTLMLTGMSANNTNARLTITAGGTTYLHDFDPFDMVGSSGFVSQSSGILKELSVSDTVTVTVTVSATDKSVDVVGTGNEVSWLSIWRVA